MYKYFVGPQSWPKSIRRFLSFRELNYAAKIHDIGYSKETKLSKKEADKLFLDIMEQSISKHPSRLKRIWLRAVAKIYYIAVVKFGSNAYKGNIK